MLTEYKGLDRVAQGFVGCGSGTQIYDLQLRKELPTIENQGNQGEHGLETGFVPELVGMEPLDCGVVINLVGIMRGFWLPQHQNWDPIRLMLT